MVLRAEKWLQLSQGQGAKVDCPLIQVFLFFFFRLSYVNYSFRQEDENVNMLNELLLILIFSGLIAGNIKDLQSNSQHIG